MPLFIEMQMVASPMPIFDNYLLLQIVYKRSKSHIQFNLNEMTMPFYPILIR